MGTTPISILAASVANRLEETPGNTIFWSTPLEIYTALIEACNDLLLLMGRPDLSVNQPYTLSPNTVWQPMPAGSFLITDIQGPSSPLWKTSLYAMDYSQASWKSDWENDVADVPRRWFPVGFTSFGIHPAVTVPVQVTITSIALPTTHSWPYTGAELTPFHDEFFQALEMYASHYCRIKETGQEFQESMSLYESYLRVAQTMSNIEDRRDPLIFSRALGGSVGINSVMKR